MFLKLGFTQKLYLTDESSLGKTALGHMNYVSSKPGRFFLVKIILVLKKKKNVLQDWETA